MGNCVGRNVEQAVHVPPPSPHPPVDVVYCGNSATSIAAAAIAEPLPLGLLLGGLNLVMKKFPETAPSMLQAYKHEMTPDHGLARLYLAIEDADMSDLPTADALRKDLDLYCLKNSSTDKALVFDTLTQLTSQIPDLLSWHSTVQPEVIVKVAELSQVLLKMNDYISAQRKGRGMQPNLDQLDPLQSLFNRAATRTGRAAHLIPTRNAIAVKHAELFKVEVSNALYMISIEGGRVLKYLTGRLQQNTEVAMAAVKNDGLALKWASGPARSDLQINQAALLQNINAIEFVPRSMRYHPEIFGLVVNSATQPSASIMEHVYSDLPFILAEAERMQNT